MSTTASSVSPSNASNVINDNSKYVIPHPVPVGSPSETAFKAGLARSAYHDQLVKVSKGMGGGDKNNKNKKSKKHNRKSAMKKRFSKKFRRSILRKKSRRMRLHKKYKKASLYGGNKLTIPSFQQTTQTGRGIINKLAENHAQTLANSAYDSKVVEPKSS
jgi:hypothetical protein